MSHVRWGIKFVETGLLGLWVSNRKVRRKKNNSDGCCPREFKPRAHSAPSTLYSLYSPHIHANCYPEKERGKICLGFSAANSASSEHYDDDNDARDEHDYHRDTKACNVRVSHRSRRRSRRRNSLRNLRYTHRGNRVGSSVCF
jgi:hypothetical protein